MAVTSVKAYLFTYNIIQVIGWSYLMLQILQYYVSDVNTSLYEHIKCTLFIFQNAALLEVVHAAVKFVPSNPFLTLIQISSRVMVVCGILLVTTEARESLGLLIILLAWTTTEIIRYLTYALNLINKVPYCLLWLRYSTFIILYPIGITGELLCVYAAMQEVRRTKMWSIDFPNKWNIMFSYHHLLLVLMLLYIPVFPLLYKHMFVLRRKVIGHQKKEEKKKVK